MPWIDDVVSHTTIRSVWGNTIRDHVVHTFASKAERDAQAVPREGMLAYCADTRITYQRVGSQWWVLSMPPRSVPANYLTAWWQPTAGGSWSMSTLAGGGAQWRQSMGWASFFGSWSTLPPQTNIDWYIAWSAPVVMAFGAPVGTSRVYVIDTGLVYGGFAGWMDNGGNASNPSRCNVGNVGNGPPAAAVVRPPSGASSGRVSIDVNVHFQCDPAQDTP